MSAHADSDEQPSPSVGKGDRNACVSVDEGQKSAQCTVQSAQLITDNRLPLDRGRGTETPAFRWMRGASDKLKLPNSGALPIVLCFQTGYVSQEVINWSPCDFDHPVNGQKG